tara:strand:- start:7841 stop:9475 length:1635 start_codon:yes stop_codon:yes gene_type:complete
MQHFYDKQIRRYLTQMIRMFSGFSYADGKGALVTVPVSYGDLTRQVANIIRDNSENKMPSAPRMSVYVTGLEMDATRLSDSSYVNKINIRERAVDANGVEYLKKEGKNYTVERLMPTPYNLTVNVDIWSSNTDQKLQILEQILMLFNPSLEIQTTDNYVDWTSLSVVNLENVTWSSRTIPSGTESEIDIASMTFKTPIYISPPAKVKKLGVIQNIITAMFSDTGLEINIDDTAYAQSMVKDSPVNAQQNAVPNKILGKRESLTSETTLITTSHNNFDLIFMNDGAGGHYAQLLGTSGVGEESWTSYIRALPQLFESGITELRLQRSNGYEIVGTVTINTGNEGKLIVNIDEDTLPNDTVINSATGIDAIIDPVKGNPQLLPNTNPRILLLGNIGHVHRGKFTTDTKILQYDTNYPYHDVADAKVFVNNIPVNATHYTVDSTAETYQIRFNEFLNINDVVEYELYLDEDGPDAWKNADGTDFAASINDIVEWDGSKWSRILKANEQKDEVFVTNLTTRKQYKWTGEEWILSFEGEYPDGTWRLAY